MKTIEQISAEQATGIRENPFGLGKYYGGARNNGGRVTPGGEEIDSKEDAYDLLRDGVSIEVPNAGAGSYREFFESLGFTKVEPWETCSSAGDWTFAVKDGEHGDWYPAFQSNRYPYHGFEYSVNFELGCESLKKFAKFNR